MRIVIVGYGPGGTAAAVAARMFNSEADIQILTEEVIEAHKKPGVSLALEFPDTKDLLIEDWSSASLSKKHIQVISGTSVICGNSKSQELQIKKNEKISLLNYDRLILSTGGVP
ncbi:MAG: FAD-dependent oxidoreductase, partial [Candidatus Thorarchaeota archaeon]